MTKLLKIGIVLVIILQVAVFIIAGSLLQKKTETKQDELAKVLAKKDDLISSQQRMEATLADLNRTIQKESAAQENISRTLASLIDESKVQVNKTAVITSANKTPAPVQTPVTTPIYRPPVTRAS